MHNGPASAVATDVESGEIAVIGEPWIGGVGGVIGCVRRNPFERSPAIFKSCGKWVFWGEPILDGDGDDICLGDDEVEVAVVEEGEGGYKAESAAVKVDEDGKL